MAVGRGKYDQEAETILMLRQAECVMVAVCGGVKGSGFSLSATSPEVIATLPGVLRSIADQIEGDLKGPLTEPS